MTNDILSSDELESLAKKVVALSSSEWCEVGINSSHNANLRYAANTVTTGGSSVNTAVHITCASGKRSGSVSSNDLSDDGLSRAVKRAEEISKLAPENEELVPPIGAKQNYLRSAQFDESSADYSYGASERARIADHAIKEARARKYVTAGFIETIVARTAFANSKGLFVTDEKTRSVFSTTMRTSDGSSSGWNKRASHAIARLDAERAITRAAEKCAAWKSPTELDPGVYRTILEPSAAADMVQEFVFSLNARDAEEGRSPFSRSAGATALGEQVAAPNVRIYSDPNHPLAPAGIYTGSGMPTEQIDWVNSGKIANFTRSRYWAEKTGKRAVPGPANIIMEGGNQLPEDFLTTVKEGLLITSFWYIRDVDMQSMLKTGLTRDGVYWIKNGEIKYAVTNFRWNESPINVLKNVEEMSKQVVTAPRDGDDSTPMMVPMMVVSKFNFSSISDAV
ncbi:MAG TPA: TldD/PmbA family protein [Candidatus Kapabacteria bacterium]|nr:TldD/PmbA family protein [Candidatus Kapabacteria bacterium]